MEGIRPLGVVLALAMFVVMCASASAAVRYAGPEGKGAEPCADQQNPCSLFTAADVSSGAGATDKVELALGFYRDASGDLGPADTVTLKPGLALVGSESPVGSVIVAAEATETPLTVGPTNVVTHIAVENRSAKYGIVVAGGTLRESRIGTNVGALLTGPDLYACKTQGGTIADTVCISHGAQTAAVGMQGTFVPGTTTELRNVSAISTNENGIGISYIAKGPGAYTVKAKSVLAFGGGADIVAAGWGNPKGTAATGATTKVELEYSNFDSTVSSPDAAAGGTAAITGSDEANNQTDPPLFELDGFHQLPESPTVDAGVSYGGIGARDIDLQTRVLGAKPDIGADEHGHPTSGEVVCDPAVIDFGGGQTTSTCKATVTDVAEGFLAVGGVAVMNALPGAYFQGMPNCELKSAVFGPSASCELTYAPPASSAGTHRISLFYNGDQNHEGSEAEATLTVIAPAAVCGTCPGPGTGSPNVAIAPRTMVNRTPPRKTTKRLAKIAFSADQADATFECKLDKKPFARCASPFKRKVKPGKHTFKVRAVGSTGIPEAQPVTVKWTVTEIDAQKSSG